MCESIINGFISVPLRLSLSMHPPTDGDSHTVSTVRTSLSLQRSAVRPLSLTALTYLVGSVFLDYNP